jgi:hypothetical protein
VFSRQEKRSLVVVWLVSYVIILGLIILSFVISFFQFPINSVFQVAAAIDIGESVGLFTCWV